MEESLRAIAERNRSSGRSELSAIASALPDSELDRTIDNPSTAAGLFAHMAFWDRLVLERWGLAAERGEGRTPIVGQVDGGLMDQIDDAWIGR